MIVLNLWGGPCSGKSTAAAAIFARLKASGRSAELVLEPHKRQAYRNEAPDQAWIVSELRDWWTSLGAGAIPLVLVTDCPAALTSCYAGLNGDRINQARASELDAEQRRRARAVFDILLPCPDPERFEAWGRYGDFERSFLLHQHLDAFARGFIGKGLVVADDAHGALEAALALIENLEA